MRSRQVLGSLRRGDVSQRLRVYARHGWLNMMLFLEKRTRDVPRALVAYDDLLGDWRRTLTEV